MTPALHLLVCLSHYNECTCVFAFLVEVNKRVKHSSSSRQLMDFPSLSLGLRGSEAQHGSAHHGPCVSIHSVSVAFTTIAASQAKYTSSLSADNSVWAFL